MKTYSLVTARVWSTNRCIGCDNLDIIFGLDLLTTTPTTIINNRNRINQYNSCKQIRIISVYLYTISQNAPVCVRERRSESGELGVRVTRLILAVYRKSVCGLQK